MYEHDSDVVRWGLQLFEGDPFSNSGYYGGVTQNNADYYHGHYFKEDYYDSGCHSVDNDVFTAHALQELSQLSVVEAPGSPQGIEHLQAPFCYHDGLGQSMGNYNYGVEELNNTGSVICLVWSFGLMKFLIYIITCRLS